MMTLLRLRTQVARNFSSGISGDGSDARQFSPAHLASRSKSADQAISFDGQHERMSGLGCQSQEMQEGAGLALALFF
jgi:hypothetical protein